MTKDLRALAALQPILQMLVVIMTQAVSQEPRMHPDTLREGRACYSKCLLDVHLPVPRIQLPQIECPTDTHPERVRPCPPPERCGTPPRIPRGRGLVADSG